MKHFLLCLIAAFWATSATAFDGRLDVSFDASALDPGEKRFLQAALARDGFYRGRLDGAWGTGSQTALSRATTKRDGQRSPTWRNVADLARDFAETLRDEDWAVVEDSRSGVSFLAPRGQMRTSRSDESLTLRTSDDALRLRAFATTARQARRIHDQIRVRLENRNTAYMVDRDGLKVTTGRLADGTDAYARSEVRGGLWSTGLIEWRKGREGQARLAVASLRVGSQGLPAIGDGALRRAMRARPTAVTPRQPETTLRGDDAVGALLGILADRLLRDEADDDKTETGRPQGPKPLGLGFYVNNTDLVVPQTLAENCGDGRLQLRDGSALRRLPGGSAYDLAFYTGATRSNAWVAVPKDVRVRAEMELTAYALEAKGWTEGPIVTTEAEVLGDLPRKYRRAGAQQGRRIVTTVPTRRRSTGAPLFDDAGRLAAVVLGAVDVPGATKAEKKDLAKVSLAVPARGLATALDRNGMLYATTGGARGDAVRPVFCKR